MPTLRVDKYFHLSTYTGSLGLTPFIVWFLSEDRPFSFSRPYLASLERPLDLIK
jgi:hypothetical protein